MAYRSLDWQVLHSVPHRLLVFANLAQWTYQDMEPIDELRKRYHDLASLAGSLAHEIKNPLSTIRMNMELLFEDFEMSADPEARRALKRIKIVNRQCEQLESLLNDFLRFTRLSTLELKPGKLNSQIEQVLEFFQTQAEKQNVVIERYFDPDLPGINLDSQTLQTALVNLVKNALESMPNGGELLARTRITRTGVALDLIDTGCGMESNALINMFKEFYTSKEGGTGLGLPTAKKIIEAHNARINVQSEVGRGTSFTIEFPTPKRI
ncbi:MAG: ATP-binding protein [Mariniblastus sp.]|nr:ATP-binding protein [Mariniblastus sp.]